MHHLLYFHWYLNIVWLNIVLEHSSRVPLCGALCILFGGIWLYVLVPPDPAVTTHYVLGVWSICISCVIEMSVEPIFLASQAFLFVKFKVIVESVAVLVRTIVFTGLVLWRPSIAVLAFSTAQILSVALFGCSYVVYFRYYMATKKSRPPLSPSDEFPFNSLSDFLPTLQTEGSLVDGRLCMLTWSFFKQGLVKQVLTEGERYIMTMFSLLSFTDQGVYDIVNNLGSLAARFVFRPIEDSAYFYFSQLVHRDKPISQQDKVEMGECAAVLEELLRVVLSVGLVVVCFGQAYSRLALMLYGGPSLAEGLAPLLLRAHSFAILLLALNGSTECYTFASMDSKRIDRYNYTMALLSVGFLVVSWLFTRLFGSIGFIMANCCNMAARIFNSVRFIRKRYEGSGWDPLRGLVPGYFFLCACFSSAILTLISEYLFYEDSKLMHFGVGVCCLIVTGSVWLLEELEPMKRCYQQVRRKSMYKLQ